MRVLSLSYHWSSLSENIPPYIYNRWKILKKILDNRFLGLIITSKGNIDGDHSLYKTLKVNSLLFRFFSNPKFFNAFITKYYCKKIHKELSLIVKLDNYDVIHAHQIIPTGLIGTFIRSHNNNIRLILSAHGHGIHTYPFLDKDYRRLTIEVLENSDSVIFVSESLLEISLNFGYSGRNAVVIPNGYDPKIFFPMDKEEVRKELGIYKENYKYVGFVGNLIEVKRADKLPEIFHLISQQIPNIMFIVVGDGYLRREIESEMKERRLEVIFTGRVEQEEVAKWMNAMDVMILPSREEGFGAVVIEAQACGTIVIGSDRGGIPEAIGFEEFVVKEGKGFEERFAHKVVEFLKCGEMNKWREKLIERARKFTWENVVKMEIEVYKNVLKD